MKAALLVVDLQNDFLTGGALAVPEGHQVVPLVDKLVTLPFELIIATKDWHPADHSSFAANHTGLAVVGQVLWPMHCVQGSWGAEFAAGWGVNRIHRTFLKGIDPLVDSYSTFFDNLKQRKTGLDDYLQSQGITALFLAGLAIDYCIKFSALDALELGYETFVIADACRGIDLRKGDVDRALSAIRARGGHIIAMAEVEQKLNGQLLRRNA